MATKPVLIDIDCIIPAAGLSTRMGSWKLMLPYEDSTILEASVKNALAVCARVILVAGYRADELIAKMAGYPNLKIVVNNAYQQGMVSSIKRGIEHVRSDYFFIAHADMPCIGAHIYHQLWQARAKGSTFPGDESRSGHPVLIATTLKQALLNDTQSHSIKAILNRYAMHYLRLLDDQIHLDVDTPRAYQQLCNQ